MRGRLERGFVWVCSRLLSEGLFVANLLCSVVCFLPIGMRATSTASRRIRSLGLGGEDTIAAFEFGLSVEVGFCGIDSSIVINGHNKGQAR